MSIDPATYTYGDSVKDKLAELFASPDCTANMSSTPAVDGDGVEIPGKVEWLVRVSATLPVVIRQSPPVELLEPETRS